MKTDYTYTNVCDVVNNFQSESTAHLMATIVEVNESLRPDGYPRNLSLAHTIMSGFIVDRHKMPDFCYRDTSIRKKTGGFMQEPNPVVRSHLYNCLKQYAEEHFKNVEFNQKFLHEYFTDLVTIRNLSLNCFGVPII